MSLGEPIGETTHTNIKTQTTEPPESNLQLPSLMPGATLDSIANGSAFNHNQFEVAPVVKSFTEAMVDARNLLTKLEVPLSPDGYADLSSLTPEQISDLLSSLVATGALVLHGTSATERFSTLQTRQANDSSKESGNQKAVYATTLPVVALMRAVLNKAYIGNNTFGESIDNINGKPSFKADPRTYGLFLAQDPNVKADGFLYALDRGLFNQGTETEFSSPVEQVPPLSFKIPKSVGDKLFVVGQGENDTVFPYTDAEVAESVERAKQNARQSAQQNISQTIEPFFGGNENLSGPELVEQLRKLEQLNLQEFFATSQGENLLRILSQIPLGTKEDFLQKIISTLYPSLEVELN